jgi:outer membrane protein OmpA-like peptidoglycan-associated protein
VNDYERRESGSSTGVSSSSGGAGSVGKRTLTESLQHKNTGAEPTPVQRKGATLTAEERQQPTTHEVAAQGLSGSSTAMPHREQIQTLFGRHSIDGIAAHVGGPATTAAGAMGAEAYATGNSVAFACAPDLHTAAHEAAHVIQQRAGVHLKDGVGEVGDAHERHADAVADRVVRGESAESLLDQYSGSGGSAAVQRSFTGVFPIPGSTSTFQTDMQTRNNAATPAGGHTGMDGSIRYIPGVGSPNANVIAFTQIVRTTAAGDNTTDINSATTPADRQARGALGTPPNPGIRTAADPAAGIEGGFKTDARHQPNVGLPAVPQGDAFSPRYPFQPTPNAATARQTGTVVQPPERGGGTGGVGGQTPGFKRSDDPADIRTAAMYDEPGSTSARASFDQSFETVARAEDQNLDLGTVKWGFSIRAGRVTAENHSILAGSTATFANALERHRDFYVHEPVTFYFDFDKTVMNPPELAKIDAFLAYLGRNKDVQMALVGFADIVGGKGAYNTQLSLRRAVAVRDAMIAKGIAVARVDTPTVAHGDAHGASTDATEAPASETPAGTGDQGGNAAVGADQNREANRWANRRVMLTFRHVPGAAGGAAGGAPAGGAAPAGGGAGP